MWPYASRFHHHFVNKPQTSVLSTFFVLVLSAAPPKFYLIKTELGQVDGIASSEEESKQENNADYFGTGRVFSPVRGGWNPNDGWKLERN